MELDKLKVGDKIRATLRCHSNDKISNISDLTLTEDGFYVDDGPDELSNNWYVETFVMLSKPEVKNE